ncbi:hypothetical protein BWI97_22015 [Siphonobacter sp. BAB-5405]|nr:hypothetical protein BWI97_22015 [Siphonobacter sp. BAB-5405]
MINSNDYKIGRIMVGASDDDVRYVHEADNLPYYHIGSVNGISMVTIDVIGHEITHALVKKTAGLIYQYESGALNESIADIMGTMLERYMLPNNWNWTLGEDAVTIRDMRTPEIYSQPSRFEGPGWESPGNCPFPFLGNDYCWVHTNSGVMNKWFHLVSTGGTFNGQNVNAIGPHAAQQIVYWALANYLQSQSTYSDARWSTMAAARDIYGECSNEHRAVIAAWNAVNVISPVCPGSGGRIAAEQIENSAESIMKVYPNPATDFVTIQLFDPITTVDLQLYDMTGKVIKAWNTKESTITFATKGLVPGIYTLKAQTPKGIYTHKVIINQ